MWSKKSGVIGIWVTIYENCEIKQDYPRKKYAQNYSVVAVT